MSSRAYSNQEPLEGTATTTPVTLTLARPSRYLEIINDSNRLLQFKFKDGADWATLRGDEAVSMEIWVKKILLQTVSGSAAYRIRVIG